MNTGMNLQHGVLLAGYGFFPSLFNLLFQVGNKIDDSNMGEKFLEKFINNANVDQRSPEVDLQLRFKILLGFVVILVILVMIFLC